MIFSFSPIYFWFFFIASLSLLSYPSVSTAQSEIKSLLSKLDNNYYYPQKKGLTNISAQLTWEQQDTSSEKIIFIKKPVFQIKGKLINHIFLKKIISNAEGRRISDDKNTEYTNFLKNYLDAFIPKTLYEKFSNHEGQVRHQKKNKIILKLTDKISAAKAKEYELLIDTEKWQISKIHIRQNQEPRSIEGKFFYTRRGDQWVVAETLSEFTVNNQTYIEKTEYTYKNLQNFWLVKKIKQTVKQDGHLIRSYRIQLNDYKVNIEN